MEIRASFIAATLAMGLVITMLTVAVGDIVVARRCADSLDTLIEAFEILPEDALVCDTTDEIGVVLDIGLTLSGGLVGFLAGNNSRREPYAREPVSDKGDTPGAGPVP